MIYLVELQDDQRELDRSYLVELQDDQRDNQDEQGKSTSPTGVMQRNLFPTESPAPAREAAPNKRAKPRTLTTRLLDAYTAAVTSRGWLVNKAGAKEHLSALKALEIDPDDIEQVIAWATDGQTSRRAYPLKQLPDDVRSWQARKPAPGLPETPPEPPDLSDWRVAPKDRDPVLEKRWPGYYDDII